MMLCLCCCKTKDYVVTNSTDTRPWCPENGSCTFRILTDKRMERHYDEHNALYVSLVDGDQWVFEIEYKKEVRPMPWMPNYGSRSFWKLTRDN